MDEASIIALIAEYFAPRPELYRLGIGDDTAILSSPHGGAPWDLFTCDCMCEGVHFDTKLLSWADAGYRCLSANVSDIAAMGGEPGPFLLSLALPGGRPSLASVNDLFGGLRACVQDHGMPELWLLGGDTVRSSGGLMLSISLLGRSAAAGPICRSGARMGERVVVFRELGGAAMGLELLRRGLGEQAPEMVAEHARPQAECALGAALGRAGIVSAMMDLSDGLVQDLGRLCRASLVRIRLEAEAVPRRARLLAFCEAWGEDWASYVLAGGEDYSLVALCAPSQLDALQRVCEGLGRAYTEIGEVVEGPPGLELMRGGRELVLPSAGFEHFGESPPTLG